ncbi:MAG: dienelactone hydrolase family protein, partial [Bacteroidales bacterium]
SQGKSKALLILISGSGWQDRNETIFGHKPFKVMADYFTRNGYAVYRYDDFPKGEFAKSTTLDFADAVFLIVNFFKNDKRFQDCPVGLIGHSEGGLITFIAASQDKRIDFIISLAGVGEHISQTLLYQMEAITRANGELSEAEVAESVEISSHLYSILEKSKSKEKALKECGDYYDAYTRNMPQEVKERIGVSTGKKIAMMQTLGSPWFYTLFHLYPKQYLKKVKCPVYALNGEKDLQVNYISNLGGIQKYLAKNKNLKIESFPGLNHLFQECETGLPEEYGKIEQTISPLVLERMLNWMNEIVK